MSWKNLKLFAIAVLLCLNVIFAASVIHQYNTENYYSAGEIGSVSDILAKSKIYVSKNLLTAKKITLPVYTREFSPGELSELVSELHRGYTLTSGDDSVTAEGDGTAWTFFYDYTFLYSKDGALSPSAELEKSGTTELITTEEHEASFNRAANDFLRIKAVNSSRVNRGAEKTGLSLYRLFFNEQDGLYVATFRQYIGGKATSNLFYLTYDGENFISGEGTFAFLLPDTEQSTDCIDLINLLFREKRLLDSKTANGDYRVQLITSAVYAYSVYFGADGVCYYVPVCNLIYSDGTMHSYNLVDGKES